MVRLTIIVPFFNTGSYICDCLDSLFLQDIPEHEYEIVCVNDFSTDNTRDYVIKLQGSHKNLLLVEHKFNKQQGAARNTGLAIARGKLIWFVDSDDIIKTNVLSYLIQKAEDNNLDILHFNGVKFNESNQEVSYKFYSNGEKIISGINFLKEYVNRFKCISTESWCKIYRKSLLIEKNILYQEGVYFEDAVHSLKAFLLAGRIQYVHDEIYLYRIHANSTMRSNLYTPEKMADWIYLSIQSIVILNTLKRSEPLLYNTLAHNYIYHVNHTRCQVFYLSSRERRTFYSRLEFYKIKNYYLRFYFIYPIRTTGSILTEFLVLIKKNYPYLWNCLKFIRRKMFHKKQTNDTRQ